MSRRTSNAAASVVTALASILALIALSLFGAGLSACNKGSSPSASADDAATSGADAAVAIVELPGVDTGSLISAEKRVFSKVVSEYMSPCGEPVTLAVCVKESRACARCLPAAKAVAKMVPKGEDDASIRAWLDLRFSDAAVKSIDVTGVPSLGAPNAPIQLVEFADFECPHCKAMAPALHALLEDKQLGEKIRLSFKEFPLPFHEHAEPAARAALAAQAQGKFWEMHALLFENQLTLANQDIEGYARKVGLDMTKFRADWDSPEIKARVAADRDQGQKIGVDGTPAIFINGRRFRPMGKDGGAEEMIDWMKLDLALGGAAAMAPAPMASASTSAAPSASTIASVSAAPSASTKKPTP
jgi:protein-disulfide isomerase